MTKKGTIEGKSPWYLARKRFVRNKLALGGLVFMAAVTLLAIFGYALAPDATENANFQVLELAKRPPGSTFTVLMKPKSIPEQEKRGIFGFLAYGNRDLFDPVPVSGRESIRFAGDTIFYETVNGLTTSALFPDFAQRIDKSHPQTQAWLKEGKKPYRWDGDGFEFVDLEGRQRYLGIEDLKTRFLKDHVKEITFWMGSDSYGRDVMSRLILGTRVSLSVGLLAVLISLLVGISLGALAGFFRGWIDTVIMWFVSVVWSIPTLLLAISITFAFEKGFWQVFVAIGLSMWVEVARIVRGQIFAIREQQFIEATRALGFKPARAIIRHTLPNIMSPVIIVAAANFAAAILIEAGLSFLGVGVQPPISSWGTMIREGYTFIIFESGKWLAIFPGLAIVLVVISLNLVGFGLRDALDPKMK